MSPREPQLFAVFGFATTHDALAAEDALRDEDLDAVPIPTPRTLGATCGIAIRVPSEQAEEARRVLASSSIDVASEAALKDV